MIYSPMSGLQQKNGEHDARAETPTATTARIAPGAPGADENDNDPDYEHEHEYVNTVTDKNIEFIKVSQL